MAASAMLQIQQQLAAALSAAPAIAGVVRQNGSRPIPAGTTTAITVYAGNSEAARRQTIGGPTMWTTVYSIELAARAASAGADPVAAIDTLMCAAWARLTSITPASLSSLSVSDLELRTSIVRHLEDADVPVAGVTLGLVVRHRTKPTSLEPA